MASILRIKRSEVSGNPGVLGAGELAYSALADNGSNGGDRLYIGMGTETAGNAVNHIVIGGKYFTDMISAATYLNQNNTLVKRDSNGSAALDVIGNVTGNATTATGWLNARNLSLTGDATATLTGIDGTSNKSAAITLATVNSNVGSFGSNTQIPVVTVNAKGLVTGVTTASISTTLGVAGSAGSGSISLANDTLNIIGGTGTATSYNNLTKTLTVSIGQGVGVSDNVTFNDLTVNGTFSSNDITAANVTVAGNAVITGNLTVQGTTTTVNSTTVAIGDANIVLAKDAANAAAADGAGLTINGANATFTYTAVNNRWNLNKDLVVANVYGALKGNADTATKWATARDLSLTGDATATLISVDGSAAVTADLTLATVNANVGNFGAATTIPTFTVNAKGLITAADRIDIPTATTSVNGLASFDSTQFTVLGGTATLAVFDGGIY